MQKGNGRGRLLSLDDMIQPTPSTRGAFLADQQRFDARTRQFFVDFTLQNKFVLNRLMLFFTIALMILIFTYVENAQSYEQDVALSFLLLDFITLLTFCLIACKTMSMLMMNQVLEETKLRARQSGVSLRAVLRMALYLVHPNRLCEGVSFVSYEMFPPQKFTRQLNEYLLVFQTTVLVYDVYKRALFLNNLKDEHIKLQIKCARISNSLFFFMKYVFLRNPLSFILKLILLSSLYFSFLLKVFEAPFEIRDQSYLVYWSNSIWTTFVTALTIGYGDCFPRTYLGRVVSIVTGISGCVTFSILATAVISLRSLSEPEEKLFNSVERSELRRDMERLAGLCIKEFLLCRRDFLRRDAHAYSRRRLRLESRLIQFKGAKQTFIGKCAAGIFGAQHFKP